MRRGQRGRGPVTGGGEGTRTPDPQNAILMLSQLSYTPQWPACDFKAPRERDAALLCNGIGPGKGKDHQAVPSPAPSADVNVP